jgi:ferredoxin-NADP reductase
MERTAILERLGGSMKKVLDWQIATVKAIKPETARVKSFTLLLPNWMRHRAGQHYDIRLTAEDGYQAQRSYSIASEPERAGEIDITVERIGDGEVSTYVHDVLVEGDRVEVRGPIGGYFVWDATITNSLLLISGCSGIVPLMSMIRHRAATVAKNPAHLLYSSRSIEDIIYHDELEKLHRSNGGLQVFHSLTRF